MTTPDHRIAMIATGQLAGFSRRQAYDVGVSARQLRSRVQSGILVQTGPNHFRSAMAPVTPIAELQGHMLDVGGLVLATALTAAALHEFDGSALRRPYHLLVLKHRHVSRNNVRLHRTDRIDLIDRCSVDGIPATSPTRTLIELARVLDREQLASCLDSALRDGRVSEDSVHRRIAALRSSGRRRRPARSDAADRHGLLQSFRRTQS